MAKNKKIDAFKEALRSKTKFISQEEESRKGKILPKKQSNIPIDNEIIKQFKNLADFHEIDYVDLMEVALEHFLDLESVWFEQQTRQQNKK